MNELEAHPIRSCGQGTALDIQTPVSRNPHCGRHGAIELAGKYMEVEEMEWWSNPILCSEHDKPTDGGPWHPGQPLEPFVVSLSACKLTSDGARDRFGVQNELLRRLRRAAANR